MRKAFKDPDSIILKNGLQYKAGNSADNKKIRTALYNEQAGFCAYTDEFISRTDAADIEHFNPTLKEQPTDNYYNWFLVKHQWNKEKSNKWQQYQLILHPTDDDFEARIIYTDGDYIPQSSNDTEAINLIQLLQLDDTVLAEKRKKYIQRKADEMKTANQEASDFFTVLFRADPCQINYPRAIKETFAVDVLLL